MSALRIAGISPQSWIGGFLCAVLWLCTAMAWGDVRQQIGPTGTFGRTTTTNYAPEDFTGVLQQAGRQIALVTAKTGPAVVHIESERREGNSFKEETGSGILMSDPRVEGLFVVTNRHVVADAQLAKISILLSDLRVIHPIAKIEDPASDIAVLRVRDPGIAPAQWGDSDNVDIGHFVLAMGSPFGLNQSVTLGIISAKGRRSLDLPGSRVINQDFLQTDAAINPGNSGGPLIDLNGRVIGINTAIASQGGGNEGIGFSIPSNLVQFVAIQLLQEGRVRRGYLGVELDEHFSLEDARRFSLDRKFGARVTRVLDNTPAARAGLRRDDIIISFDGIDIADETDLINRVSLTPVNKQVQMVVVRNGQRVSLGVTLSERSREESLLPEKAIPQPVGTRIENVSRPTVVAEPVESLEAVVPRTLPLNARLAQQLGYRPQQAGLLVLQLAQRTPLKPFSSNDGDASESAVDQRVPVEAEDLLQLYDVIEEAGREPVRTAEELRNIIRSAEGPVVLKVTRVIDAQPVSRLVFWQP